MWVRRHAVALHILAPLFLAALVAGCRSVAPAVASGQVQHVVVCWLKEPGNQAQRDALIAASRRLAAIPDVLSLRVGTMLPSERPIVDSTFDVALVVTLANADALHRYLADPLHQQLSRDVLQPRTRQVRVYDFTE